jgi:hypothetical protein
MHILYNILVGYWGWQESVTKLNGLSGSSSKADHVIFMCNQQFDLWYAFQASLQKQNKTARILEMD